MLSLLGLLESPETFLFFWLDIWTVHIWHLGFPVLPTLLKGQSTREPPGVPCLGNSGMLTEKAGLNWDSRGFIYNNCLAKVSGSWLELEQAGKNSIVSQDSLPSPQWSLQVSLLEGILGSLQVRQPCSAHTSNLPRVRQGLHLDFLKQVVSAELMRP